MGNPEPDIDRLIEQALRGDLTARESLLAFYRGRLLRMVASRLDPRVVARVDPSDVVQEALADAHRLLTDYLREQPVPFYTWLRRLAWERLVKLHRRHIFARKRTVAREAAPRLSDGSVDALVGLALAKTTSPSDEALRVEDRAQIRDALEQLSDRDRELLILRYVEQLSAAEIAVITGSTPGAVRVRHLRALRRLRLLIGACESGGKP
jgi:RNA polymerase sigma-70 factor (ECF subfamily)